MDLPTYTNIWRIEKRLYKLYDLRLPMPLPLVQIGVFLGVFVPWIVMLQFVGVPFESPWHVLYIVPPGVLTWLATRPVIEGKRLTELLISQSRYLAEPRTWCRLTPIREPREVVIVARVWRRAGAPAPVAAPERAAIKSRRRRGQAPAQQEPQVPAVPLPRPAAATAPPPLPEYAAQHEAPAAPRKPWRRTHRDISHEDDVQPAAGLGPPPATPHLDAPAPAPPSGKRALASGVRRPGSQPEVWEAAPTTRPDIPQQPPTARPQPTVHNGAPPATDRDEQLWSPGQTRRDIRQEPPAAPETRHALPARGTPPSPQEERRGPHHFNGEAGDKKVAGQRTPPPTPIRPHPPTARARATDPQAPSAATRSTGAQPRPPETRPAPPQPPESHPAAGQSPATRARAAGRDLPAPAAPAGAQGASEQSRSTNAQGPSAEARAADGQGRSVEARSADVQGVGPQARSTVEEGRTVEARSAEERGASAWARSMGSQGPSGETGPADAQGASPRADSADAQGSDAQTSPVKGLPAQARSTDTRSSSAEARAAGAQGPTAGARPADAQGSAAWARSMNAGGRPADAPPAGAQGASPDSADAQGASAEARSAGGQGARPVVPGAFGVRAEGAEADVPPRMEPPRPWTEGLSQPPRPAAPPVSETAAPPQPTAPVEQQAPPREVRSQPTSPVRPRPLPPPPAPPPSGPAITPPDPEHEVTGGGLRRLFHAVGGGHGDVDAEYEMRLQQPFHGTRHVVVLGCTGGAGQTVTALMLGHTFAQHNGEPVVAVDVNPGPGALARRTRSDTNETLTGLITRADQVNSLTAMRRYTSQAKSGLDVIAAGKNPLQALDDRDYALAIRTIDRFYSVTLLDAAAAVVARVLPYADQLVLVAPASADAPRAVAMTFEWLDGHGYEELRSRAVTVINGVSRRSMDDVEQAEAVARGRCRALVRIPWDDHLSMDRAPRNELKSLRTPTRRAYLALAGVVAGGFTVMPERYQEFQHEQEATR
ncbi:conjugal transfer protein [Actinomadura spongiicola]|uniref:Conjugal transfer protein n=1 Tax=Actinomadura spongiicola TaxID=2303421 RepID=A0A372GI00_9ACTN|nr:conjugal transfer protein [Actinomadura spongiicola]RFS84749.1 conjugal transfer protein [Actinomadura spongiicola]